MQKRGGNIWQKYKWDIVIENTISFFLLLLIWEIQYLFRRVGREGNKDIWGLQPGNMTNRDIYWRRYKTQETLYIEQWHLSPFQSRHIGTSHDSPNRHQLTCCIFLNLINGLKSLPFQRWFLFWEKPEVAGHQIWAYRFVMGLSHLGDLMFHQNTLHKTWCMSGCIVMTKLPITSCP